MRELNGLMPKIELLHANGNITWAKWKDFKVYYNMNGVSLRNLVKEHASVLKLKGTKQTNKTKMKLEEMQYYISFLERKKNTKSDIMVNFCVVTTWLERTMFSTRDDTINMTEVRKDQIKMIPLCVDHFQGILGASRHGINGVPSYNPFITKFMEYKLLVMREPHVWLWIVKQEKVSIVTKLYKETNKFKYNIFHNTNVPAKTEGIVANNKVKGNRQVRALSRSHFFDVQCS